MGVRTMGTAWSWAGAMLLLLVPQVWAQVAPAPAAQPQQMLRYGRAAEGGTKALNLPDAQGAPVLEVAARGLLAVHAERNGWLEVESPGGFRVWVFGEFLKDSSVPGMVEVTGNDVRMRPLPSSGTESYPLGQYLSKGERLRLIQRNDPTKPLDKDWVQVDSPPGARAWVQASETQPLESGVSGAALWSTAVKEAAERHTGETLGTVQPKGTDTLKVREAVQNAEAALARERAKDAQRASPDYASVLKAFEDVLALEPGDATAELVRSRIEQVKAMGDAVALRGDLELELARREAELQRRQQAMDVASKRGVFDGRYDLRGWLEKRQLPGETEPTYVLRFAGDQLSELVCLSGRYDLSIFADCELGLNGRQLRSASAGTLGTPGRPSQLDVSRLEVLATRATRR